MKANIFSSKILLLLLKLKYNIDFLFSNNKDVIISRIGYVQNDKIPLAAPVQGVIE